MPSNCCCTPKPVAAHPSAPVYPPPGPERNPDDVLILGAGVFGLSAALEWKRRFPHAHVLVVEADTRADDARDAASCDVNKIVRFDYGSSAVYRDLGLAAVEKWRAGWPCADATDAAYVESGVLFVCPSPDRDFAFADATLRDADTWILPASRTKLPPATRVRDAVLGETGEPLAARFPAMHGAAAGLHGYLQPSGGWAYASKSVAQARAAAQRLGVVFVHDTVTRVVPGVCSCNPAECKCRMTGDASGCACAPCGAAVAARKAGAAPAPAPACTCGGEGECDPACPAKEIKPMRHPQVLLASGELRSAPTVIVATGAWTPALVPGLAPPHLAAQMMPVIKLAVPEHARERYVSGKFPTWAVAVTDALDFPIASTRLCTYTNTRDHHFHIHRRPGGVVLATGGSGHGFKFFPVLGDVITRIARSEACEVTELFAHAAEGEKTVVGSTWQPAVVDGPSLADQQQGGCGLGSDEDGAGPRAMDEETLVSMVGKSLNELTAV
ncbi:hypothetical protein H9P43_007756 [Blastocladiella emersonii ATCC 22665]|nr:hypothetical protein H9P43_007756 [Blastocladiella emersonii ATCC 22665]